MNELRTIGITRETFVDIDTGEVLGENIIKHRALINDDNFFLMYSGILGLLEDMSSTEVKVFSFILQRYNSGTEFQLGNPIKRLVANKYDTSLGTVSNAITSLKTKGLLHSLDRGLYEINPLYAWKGNGGSRGRNERLKYILELEADGIR